MNKRLISILFHILIFISFLLIYKVVILNHYIKYEYLFLSIFFIIFTFSSVMFFGLKQEIKTLEKKTMFKTLVVELIIYFVIIHCLGFYLGFTSNALSYEIDKFIYNLIFPIIIIICSELIRYVYVNSSKNNKWIYILITILLTVFDVFTSINVFKLNEIIQLFLFFTMVVLPSVTKNFLLTYLAINSGYKICIFYRLVVELYPMISPIFADLGNYLGSVMNILLPFIIYCTLSSRVKDKEHIKKQFNKRKKYIYISDIVSIAIIAILIILMSGITKYSMVSIASDSMVPAFSKGDSVILESYEKFEEIKKDDIIGFMTSDGKITVHRVIKVNDKTVVTKGDANNANDKEEIKFKDIKGKVVLILPYIGYPSVYISENSGD